MKQLNRVNTNNNTNNKQQGFTLIEVLVASFILFLVIASVTMVYRGALLSSFKAEQVLRFSSMVEPISEQIRSQIKDASGEGDKQGNGAMGELTYHWSATVSQQGTAPEQFNFESGEVEAGKVTFYLWHIELQLQFKTATRQYQFTEVTW